MPLKPGRGKRTVSSNIREMIAAGHPKDQAVAAALRESKASRKKKSKAKASDDE